MKSIDIYEILVKEHQPMLQAYILGIVKDHGMTDDILQETFLQAYRKLSTLKDKEAFASWIRAIGRNFAIRALKQRGREISMEPRVIQGMEDVFRKLDDSRLGDPWVERVKVVEQCFKMLPEKLRTVCRLHYFEDKKAREIASSLQVGLPAVLKRLERAREAIRKCAEKRFGLEGI